MQKVHMGGDKKRNLLCMALYYTEYYLTVSIIYGFVAIIMVYAHQRYNITCSVVD